jgi:hypothetical protein
MAFRAQRSVEICTLEPVEQHLLLDAGLLHPDDARRYAEKEIKEPELLSKMQQSWIQLLEPIGMQQRYLSYFDKQHDLDVVRPSFTAEDPQFGALLSTRRFSFRVEANDIPIDRDDANVTGVRLALVGASHPANEVSCDVRHGANYEQRRADGSIDVQQLKSLVNNRVTRLQALAGDRGLRTHPAPPAVGSLAFWGRGIGGDWEISIPGSRLNADLKLSQGSPRSRSGSATDSFADPADTRFPTRGRSRSTGALRTVAGARSPAFEHEGPVTADPTAKRHAAQCICDESIHTRRLATHAVCPRFRRPARGARYQPDPHRRKRSITGEVARLRCPRMPWAFTCRSPSRARCVRDCDRRGLGSIVLAAPAAR